MNSRLFTTACAIGLFAGLSVMTAGPVMAQSESREGGQDAGESRLDPIEVSGDSGRESDAYINLDQPSQVGKNRVSVADTPQSIEVVEQDFIQDIGAQTIEDALVYSSGVFAEQFGFDTRVDTVSVRGLDASRYLDGLRSIYGFYNSVRTNPYALERIEVLKGPSSVLYGQSELGGIINAVSKLPRAEQQGEIWAQAGSFSRMQFAMDLTGPLTESGNLLYRLVALGRDADTQVDFVEDDGYVLSPSLTWKPRDGTELTVLLNRQVNTGKVSAQFLPSRGTIDPAPRGRIPTNTFVGEPEWDRYDREKTEVTLFLDQRLTANWDFRATARHTDSEAETREHWTQVGEAPDDDGNIPRTIFQSDKATDVTNLDLRLEGVVQLGPTRHHLAIGLDHQDALFTEDNYYSGPGEGGTINVYDPQYGNLQSQVLDPVDRPDSEIRQTGLYLIDHIEIDRLVVSAALRRDDSENTTLAVAGPDTTTEDEVTTGRAGLMYRFDSGISPYVSYAESFVPNLGTDEAGGTLEPTTGSQEEIGLKFLSRRHSLSVDMAWFDIEQEDRVARGSTPGGVTQTGAVVDGWEAQVKKRFGRFEVLANYTRLDARDASAGTRLGYVAEELASVWSKYRFVNGFRLGAGARHQAGLVGGGGATAIPDVTLYDAMVGYRTGAWDFSVNAQNVSDKTYVSWCRGPGLDCGYGSRRNVTANVRYRY